MEREVSEAHPNSLLQPPRAHSPGPLRAGTLLLPHSRGERRPGPGRGPEPPSQRPGGETASDFQEHCLQTARSAERVNQERLPAVVLWSKP